MTYLLDTNVVSEWVRPRPEPNVVAWLADLDEDRVFLSVVTLAELRHGIELLPQGRRRDRLTAWASEELPARFEGRILAIDRRIAETWGAVMGQARRAGVTIGTMDGFLAATAIAHDLTVVTRDVADFAKLDVAIFNPWEPP